MASPQSEAPEQVTAKDRRGGEGAPAVVPPKEETNRSPIRRIVVTAIFILLAGLAAVAGYHYWRYASAHVSTDDAALAADVVQIAPQVSGTIKQVLVEDNQMVKAGTLLVVLDDDTYRAAVDQAQANLDAAIAQAQGAGVAIALTDETGDAQLAQAQGVVAQADSSIAGAKADANRAAAAVSNVVATAGSTEANIRTAQAAIEVARANKKRAEVGVISAQAQVETARASVLTVQANVEAAQAVADKAARDARRYAELHDKGVASASMTEQAAATARSTQAQLESVRRQVDAANSVVAVRMADLDSARIQVEAAAASITQASAQVSTMQELTTAAHANIQQALAQQNVAQQNVHQAEARRAQALGQVKQAHTTPRQVDVSRSTHAQALAKIEQARAALTATRIQLHDACIYAPVDGQISKKSAEVGALVQPGTPLMAIVTRRRLWVVANFKETQLSAMRAGEQAEITVDSFPAHKFHGHVDSIAAATGATFALLPPDNATGNFTKVVQRIPVKIILNPDQPDIDRLRAGMSVRATITVH